ncbi:T9SS type A sorting domain-containing protein [Parabacteroides sp. PF5-9]|uniref:T9SS type A sorting domain-containing protein n=1 Tax=Parabacteroides sp. PF5-9 TaxID=1742404 RepID=UPI0024765791|nr:T9SS type A sorting domain-containing protein [Parabacteroides sp. PF5-9]MDH6358081.1 hypothetical protein [Parabacteroides sp. PF5-9]
MRKIFTSFCLAAMALMMTLPMVAQERQLSNGEKTMVVKKVVPAIFDQVKEMTGFDFLAFTKPGFGIEDVVNSLPYTQSSALRADKTPLTLQPDSMVLDLSTLDIDGIPAFVLPLLKNVKVYFADYQKLTTTTGEQPVEIAIPGKISVNIIVPNALSMTLTFGEKVGILPFGEMKANLEINEALAGMIPIPGGELFSYKESLVNNVFNYNLVIGDALRAMIDEEGENPTPNMLVKLDITKMQTNGTVEASLFGIPKGSTTQQVQMGDAVVYMNLINQAALLPVDSILLTSYEMGVVKGYRKLTTSLEPKSAQDLVLTTQDSVRLSKNEPWEWAKKQIVTMTDYTSVNTPKAAVADLLSKAVFDLATTSGGIKQYAMQVDVIVADISGDGMINDDDKITTMLIDIIPSMGGTVMNPIQAFDMNIWTLPDTEDEEELLRAAELGLEQVMNIKAELPVDKQTIDITFSPIKDGVAVPMATAYVKSNAMSIITTNDPVALSDLDIIVQDGGLYILNGENATYAIVSLQGTTLANGRINSPSQFISLSNMMKGGIYILTVNQNGLNKSVKFIKK